ncbi:hypothetical protein SmJEL517_g02230 [Synchytrium microbalum]|uniref:CBS domain-containing protein n=1 Tax=Synchytrium microbalum TaxID=1806994 RepID=A0A507CCI3_9FUNG|nr:uncharacterized protein SmJEL517_g02230 [Synchytrium microbalum]TPX35275.1 hypothetical protein SmJEL517_g02230 [Synchytrium microbalum]
MELDKVINSFVANSHPLSETTTSISIPVAPGSNKRRQSASSLPDSMFSSAAKPPLGPGSSSQRRQSVDGTRRLNTSTLTSKSPAKNNSPYYRRNSPTGRQLLSTSPTSKSRIQKKSAAANKKHHLNSPIFTANDMTFWIPFEVPPNGTSNKANKAQWNFSPIKTSPDTILTGLPLGMNVDLPNNSNSSNNYNKLLCIVTQLSKIPNMLSSIATEFFDSKTVQDLIFDRRTATEASTQRAHYLATKLGDKIVQISPNATIEDALQIMKEEKLLALPVAEPPQSTLKFKSLVSIDTLLKSVFARGLGPTQNEDGSPGQRSRLLKETIASHLATADSQPKMVYTDEPLKILLHRLGTGGEKHVLVTDRSHIDDANYYTIVSQTDVLHYLSQNRDKVPGISTPAANVKQLVASVGEQKAPILASHKTTALEIAESMVEGNFSCIGITGENGKLIANISWADYRGLNSSVFASLDKPALEFAERVQSVNPRSKHIMMETKTATTQEVMKSILENHVHRVWLVDDNAYADGIVTISDIIAFLGNV